MVACLLLCNSEIVPLCSLLPGQDPMSSWSTSAAWWLGLSILPLAREAFLEVFIFCGICLRRLRMKINRVLFFFFFSLCFELPCLWRVFISTVLQYFIVFVLSFVLDNVSMFSRPFMSMFDDLISLQFCHSIEGFLWLTDFLRSAVFLHFNVFPLNLNLVQNMTPFKCISQKLWIKDIFSRRW